MVGWVQYQQVVCEWLPWFCTKCDKVGYYCEKEPLMKWVPKVNTTTQGTLATPHITPAHVQQPFSAHDVG